MVQPSQRDLDRLQQRFDEAFQALLGGRSVHTHPAPSDLVYAEGAVQVLRYRSTAHRLAIPLLIVPSMICPPTIFDLAPDSSLVAYLVGQGIDVFLLDWGEPGSAGRAITLDEYIAGVLLRAAGRVCDIAGSTQLSLLGYGMGGTFVAIWAALNSARVRNLVQIAAPINFHDAGLLSQWTRKDRFNADLVVDTIGAMPPALMQASFKMLTPAAQIMQQIALAETFGDDDAIQDLLAMQSWINNMPAVFGEAYRTWIKDCYQENYLVQGKLVIDRRRVDLTQIDCPLLTVVASKDYLCPPQSAAVLNHLVSSADRQVLELPGGHVGLVIGPGASGQLWPRLADWLRVRSGGDAPTPGDAPAPQADAELPPSCASEPDAAFRPAARLPSPPNGAKPPHRPSRAAQVED
ncbi:MAG TPA: alpha/beta fold hydrolase [Roseiflexaceae bacterium]|nr:alpha/beta fold hydrolase [Roseiflexaceae bacterium]